MSDLHSFWQGGIPLPSFRLMSGQSLVATHVEGLPFQKRLDLDAFLKGCIGGQDRRVDFTFLQQEVEECLLGFGKRKQSGQAPPGLPQQLRPVFRE